MAFYPFHPFKWSNWQWFIRQRFLSSPFISITLHIYSACIARMQDVYSNGNMLWICEEEKSFIDNRIDENLRNWFHHSHGSPATPLAMKVKRMCVYSTDSIMCVSINRERDWCRYISVWIGFWCQIVYVATLHNHFISQISNFQPHTFFIGCFFPCFCEVNEEMKENK